nr:hypothetical protein [Lachnospiraceae bacterium]
MKNRKRKSHILPVIACFFGLLVLCAGCGKLAAYDVEQYRTQEDASIYCFTEPVADLENIVATAQYDDEHILLYEELLADNEIHKKTWIFSYMTGEKKLCSDLAETADKGYRVTEDRISILSASPLVLADLYTKEIYLYTDDFSQYSVFEIGDFEMPGVPIVRGDNLYFIDNNSGKIYVHGIEEFCVGAKQTDYEMLCDESRVIFVPDVNMANCRLDGVSEDEREVRVYAESLIDGEYYYYIYDVQTGVCKEMYRFEDEKDFEWSSWEYGKCLTKVVPSAVDRYEMTDYEQSRIYTAKIEPSAIYSHVKYDRNIAEETEKLLFYSVDENKERITELFLWEYGKAESEPADAKAEKIKAEIPVEVDYEQLTEKAEILEEKYGINIIMGENVVCEFDAYEYEQVTNEERIYLALEQVELAMGAFPDGMCAEMSDGYAQGFNVYLCGNFKPKNKENISDAGAFFVFDNNCYNVALNIMQDNTEANFIHEMTHAIDDYFGFCGATEALDDEWQNCNPEGFEYLLTYFDYEEEFEYTYCDDFEHIDEVYFCDTYAKTYPGEDRSRVFEYFGSEFREDDVILKSESLRKKARLLLDYCTKYLECFRVDEDYGLKTKAEKLGW